MFGNINDMMKQAKKLQEKMAEAQEKITSIEVEGSSGGGLVKVTANGKGTIKRVQIDPTLLVPDEKEVLEDLLIAATHDAQTKAEEKANEEMNRATGGMNLPQGMKLPF